MNPMHPISGDRHSFARSLLLRALLIAGSWFLFVTNIYAANRFWIRVTPGSWNSALNWAATTGGAGGAGVPGTGDRVYFDNNGKGNCSIDIPVSISTLNVDPAYTGTISQGTNSIIISGTAGFGGGVFNGGSANITIGGVFTLSGTVFTASSAVLEFQDNAAFTGGSFIHNNGSVRLNNVTGSVYLTGNSPSFYVLELAGNGNVYNINSAGDVTVSHSLNISGNLYCRINNGVIDVPGDIKITNTATGGGGSTQINITGSGTQNINGGTAAGFGALPQLNINSTGTVNLTGFPTVANNFTYTSGTVVAAGSTLCFTRITANPITVAGSLVLSNVWFLADASTLTATIPAGTILTVTGTLTMAGTGNLNINSPTAGTTAIQAKGDIMINNSSAGGGGNAGILINGTGTQYLTSSVAAGLGRLPYISIQKPSGTLVLGGVISERRDWTYISGGVDAVTSAATVVFGGNGLNVSSNGMSFYHVTVSSNTTTLLNNLTVTGNLTIGGGALSAGANTINLAGSWNNSGGTFTEGTSTVNFNGASLQTMTSPGGENFYNLTVNNTGAGIRMMNASAIRNTFNMNQGNIDLNGNSITLGISGGNSGTLVYSSGALINTGSFSRWFNSAATIADGSVSGLFPTGTATDFRPLYVSAPVTKPTSSGTITVSYTDAGGNSVVSIPDGVFTVSIRKDLNWNISTGNGLAGGLYNLDVRGTGLGQIGGVNDLRLTLANGVAGAAGVNAGTTANPQINRTGLLVGNLSNAFYIGSVNPVSTTLPVILISFTAEPVNGRVKLDWETAFETNNNYFTIQRSANAGSWADIQQIKSKGDGPQNYMFYDESPLSGTSYYRLQQTDMDGRETRSAVREVEINKQAAINIYPNPASDFITIGSLSGKNVNIVLLNGNGQRMRAPVIYNGSSATLNLSACPAGIYFIQIVQGKSNEIRKIVIGK